MLENSLAPHTATPKQGRTPVAQKYLLMLCKNAREDPEIKVRAHDSRQWAMVPHETRKEPLPPLPPQVRHEGACPRTTSRVSGMETDGQIELAK